MPARILDGKRIADELLDRLKIRVAARVAAGKTRPGLAVILVGDEPASSVYVRNKRRACRHVGFDLLDELLRSELVQLREILEVLVGIVTGVRHRLGEGVLERTFAVLEAE